MNIQDPLTVSSTSLARAISQAATPRCQNTRQSFEEVLPTKQSFLDAFEAPGPAMMALMRYREAGGGDPVLIEELSRMERLNLIAFDFDEAEVIEGR